MAWLALGLPLAAAGGPVRIACVGDSLTWGGFVEPRDVLSYPARLQELLGDRAVVANFGHGGRALLSRADHPFARERAMEDALAFAPDLVLLMLGTNDTKPPNWRHAVDFRDDALALVERFRSLPSRPRVCVLLPPPIFRPAYELDGRTLRYRVLPAWCAAAADAVCPVVDLHTPFLDRPERFPDAVHPDAAGYLAIAMLVHDALTGPDGPLTDREASADPWRPRPNVEAALAGDDWLARHVALSAAARAVRPAVVVFGDAAADGRGPGAASRHFGTAAMPLGIAGDGLVHIRWRLRRGALDGGSPRLIVVSAGEDEAAAAPPAFAIAGLRVLLCELRARHPAATVRWWPWRRERVGDPAVRAAAAAAVECGVEPLSVPTNAAT